MKGPDFNQKNMEYLAYQVESGTEKMIYDAIQFTQGMMNDNTGNEWFQPGNLNTIEYVYKMTYHPARLFTTEEYIAFLNKYDLRIYLDISKL